MRLVLTLQVDDFAHEWSTDAEDVATGVQELCARVMAAYPTSAVFTPAAEAEPLTEEPELAGETH